MKLKHSSIFIAIAAMLSCTGNEQQKPFVQNVCVTQPVKLGASSVHSYCGIVQAAHEINLGFKTPGQLSKIHVKEGDYVRKGQILAELDASDYILGVSALQIQYDQLANEVERMRQLHAQKSITGNDFEKAEAGLKQLGVQLQSNKNKVEYTKLCSPADGYIQKVNFCQAEMVDAGTAVFSLLDVSGMEITADIPVSEYQQKNNFTDYCCKISGEKEPLPLRLISLSPKADGNQLYQMKFALKENAKKKLTAGMNVTVCISVKEDDELSGYKLPLSAVFEKEGEPCVWILNQDSTLSLRKVMLWNTAIDGHAAITGGLDGSEEIVRAGVSMLQEGQKVRKVEEPSKTNAGGLL